MGGGGRGAGSTPGTRFTRSGLAPAARWTQSLVSLLALFRHPRVFLLKASGVLKSKVKLLPQDKSSSAFPARQGFAKTAFQLWPPVREQMAGRSEPQVVWECVPILGLATDFPEKSPPLSDAHLPIKEGQAGQDGLLGSFQRQTF